VGWNLAVGPAGLLPPPPPCVAQAAQQARNAAQPAYILLPKLIKFCPQTQAVAQEESRRVSLIHHLPQAN
jgi:hypothetical protein